MSPANASSFLDASPALERRAERTRLPATRPRRRDEESGNGSAAGSETQSEQLFDGSPRLSTGSTLSLAPHPRNVKVTCKGLHSRVTETEAL
ncbi:hypothetical protein EYF80_023264 [Liparis tanakae]|uniref:Uncharacterized protein n=1 Tax=Liparis tanakae TaxID=230148 RepID=A0A4Z2HL53_9TELE|nr:hypothetical protein EYF80_023264 [Liparis tanakae]